MTRTDQFWQDYRDRCEREIATLEEMLSDWSDEGLTFQSRKAGEAEWTDQKPGMITHIERTIAMYRRIIERIDDEHLA